MLELLISSSVLILALAILRRILRAKISARLQYALWLLVLVRLLVPVSFFHSPVSVAEAAVPLAERAWTTSHTVLYTRNAPEAEVTEPSGVPTQSEGSGITIPGQALLLRDALLLTWYAGMGIMAVWFLLVNARLALRLKKNRTPYDAAAKLPVYVASELPSPCLFGLIRPAIYLTEQAASDPAQARQIVAHELTHYRHGDMIWALLRSVCLVVWWFNPLVWLAAALSRQDCELACDEGTIKALGEAARFDYGRTLVGMAAIGARPSDLLCGATTMTTGRKSLKERVTRIANAPKMSVSVAVIVLIIAAVAVGCTFSGAKQNDVAVEPEVAMEAAPAGSASVSDAAALRPGVLDIAFFDAESATNSSDIVTEQIELGEFYDFFRFMDAKSTQDVEGPGFSRPVSRTTLFFFDDLAAYEHDERTTGFAVWEDGWFEFFHGENGDTVFYDEDGSYLRLFKDIIDKWYSESAEAVFVSGEPLGGYDRAYWEEVDRELASFAYPADIRVFVSDYFDAAIPEDSIFGPMTMEDYIYGTDGWKFEYNSEHPALDPDAQIILYDADGRSLWIQADMNALMIEEADGSITWVEYRDDPVDCADMIRHLLPWARGEYPTREQQLAYEEEDREVIDAIVEELGHYGFPNRTEYHISGGSIRYDNGVVYNLPEWAAAQQGISGVAVYAAYGTETENIDLQYERFWRDGTNTVLVNAEMFENARSYYRDVLARSVTDGLRVNGHDAYVYYIPPYDAPAIMWYDADAELIFHLTEYSVGTDPQFPPLDELIALAETVAPR